MPTETVPTDDRRPALAAEPRRGGRHAPAWVWAVLLWAVPVVVTAAQPYVAARLAGHPVSGTAAVARELSFWSFWIVATPAIAWLVRRVRPVPGRWMLALPVHLAAAVTVSCSAQLYYGLLRRLEGAPIPPEYRTLASSVRTILLDEWLGIGLLLYTVVAGAVVAVDMTRRYHERDERAADREAQLEAQLARAQLDALRAQLNPHFLFNALNSVAMLVRAGSKGDAVRVLAELGQLLRHVLYGPASPEVPLREELAFVRHYLAIERVRFRDRLTVEIDVDPAVLDAAVPNLVLQPLVENALKHGIAGRADGGCVAIRASAHAGVLALAVTDDGAGLAPGPQVRGPDGVVPGGVGLANVRSRLERLYGAAFRFDVAPRDGGGVVASVELPLRIVASSPPAAAAARFASA